MLPLDNASDTAAREPRDARLNLRASARQDSLIRRAAEASDKTVSEFILDSAMSEAEQVLADRRWFPLDEQAWRSFEAILDRPAVFKPRLSESVNQADPFVD